MKKIKTTLIGAGYRGKQLLQFLQNSPFFEVMAVADPYIENTDIPEIICYNNGEEDYLNMLDRHKPELVFITSPWQCHVHHAIQCVERQCHVALEIKGGLYLDEYQPLIDMAEQKSCRVFPLENTLFRRDILAICNMVDAGVFGEIIYMRGGYRHDLRSLLLDDAGNIGHRGKTESVWRSKFYQSENGDLYPTHGLAPLCMIAGINRTDHFKSLTSLASKSAGLLQRIKDLGGNTNVEIKMGDIVSTQIETEKGILISLIHDTTLPRPRSLDFEVQGTKGIWQGDNSRIYVEGVSPDETWESDLSYIERYESIYWQQWGRDALLQDAHHQGMDYIMLKVLEADLQGKLVYPATLNDLALWTSVSPWSKVSIAERKTIYFPE
ncbi:Gfo/Idh/MocA family oxidoreductase [Bacteroides sp.]|uniref:Gfo/Idh/MocA family protein n=1 Tax=Bacteroides sp. TaxID=29523 RepID=UPI0025BE505D|nr:Gfo/Idh/MocA family oxidoreductase [Bacteroides sp.]